MSIEELKYILDDFNDIPETNRYWCGREMSYENDYIKVIRLDDSNRHNKHNYNKLDKMWSIVYCAKQPFLHLPNFKIFQKEYNAYISPVLRGKYKGCFGIRIPDMKECPTIEIANKILNFIFNV